MYLDDLPSKSWFPGEICPLPSYDFFAKGESAGPVGLREVEPGDPDDRWLYLECQGFDMAIWQNGRTLKQTGGLIDTSTAFGIYNMLTCVAKLTGLIWRTCCRHHLIAFCLRRIDERLSCWRISCKRTPPWPAKMSSSGSLLGSRGLPAVVGFLHVVVLIPAFGHINTRSRKVTSFKEVVSCRNMPGASWHHQLHQGWNFPSDRAERCENWRVPYQWAGWGVQFSWGVDHDYTAPIQTIVAFHPGGIAA